MGLLDIFDDLSFENILFDDDDVESEIDAYKSSKPCCKTCRYFAKDAFHGWAQCTNKAILGTDVLESDPYTHEGFVCNGFSWK